MTAASFIPLRGVSLRVRVLCIILALLPGPVVASAQPVAPAPAGSTGTSQDVTDIKIVGNQRVESDAIRVHITQQTGQPLNMTAVDDDVKAIAKMGFFSNVHADFKDGVLSYYVTERPLLTDLRFNGMENVKPSSEEIINALAIHAGAIYDPIRARTTTRNITEVYQQKGYLDAVVTFKLIMHENNLATGVIDVHEGPQVKISQIDFTGNKAFSARQLRNAIETRKHNMLSWLFSTGYLDQKKLQGDVDHLTSFYYEHGYVNAQVSQPTVARRGDSLVVTFPIDEGPQYHVGTVGVSGNLLGPEKELMQMLTLKPKQVFSGSDMQHDVLTLSDFYSDRGYAYVNVDPRTQADPTTRTLNVTYFITPGREVVVDRIKITGNTKTSDKVIRRELVIQEQEPYSTSRIAQSKQRLDSLGYFSNTRISTDPGPTPEKIDLNIAVQEQNTASLQMGGGYDSYSSVFGNFSIRNSNLFGGGESVAASAQIGFLYQNYNVSYTEPWFLDMPMAVTLQAFYDKIYLFTFDQSNAGVSVTAAYPLADLGLRRIGRFRLNDINLTLGYTFENVGISGLSEFTTYDIWRYKGYHLESKISPGIRRYTVDNPLDPRSGSIQSFNLDLAGVGAGDAFVKGMLHGRWFFPYIRSPRWGEWVFSPGFTYAIGTTLTGGFGGELPLYERYFPGGNNGPNSVRGYQLYSLGPQVTLFDQQGTPFAVEQVGGSQELIMSGETTFPIYSPFGLRGATFIDAGNSFFLHDTPKLYKLQAAWGFGVRWKSPFGPLAVNVAFPTNPRDNDQHTVFDIGAGAPL
ncbi:MAG TPA: outer membrane protein assembly factor BamA [Candidatus Binataceae bacterium]|nr:outer membrane protein assembly factor BamA [Candidatus Binataceae bacterium]